MKKTIYQVISEYGLQPGPPTSVGQQSMGSTQQVAGNSPATKAPVRAKGSELVQGNKFKDPKTGQTKVVSSPIGDGTSPDAVVAQDPRTKEYSVVQGDEQVQLTQEELDIRRLRRKDRKMKRLLRAQKFGAQDDIIFELNFNKPELQAALDYPIECGFEAETVWTSIDIIEYESVSWYDDEVQESLTYRDLMRIENSYLEWGYSTGVVDEFKSELAYDFAQEHLEDETKMQEYIDDYVAFSEIEEYRDGILADLDAEELEDYEDWDDEAWGRDWIDSNDREGFEQWLIEEAMDDEDIVAEAIEKFQYEYSIDDYAQAEHGSVYQMLLDFEVEVVIGTAEATPYIERWAHDNSEFGDVESYTAPQGELGQTNIWRLEPDVSIQGDGLGVEIVSPVFSTPREMLNEMMSLFKFMAEEGVETNETTGLHITMSWAGEEDTDYFNPAKMALLLGDQYMLKQFGRQNNRYTSSQLTNIQNYVKSRPEDQLDNKKFQYMDNLMRTGMSSSKFSSINVKDQQNAFNNSLVEFRIAGGSDYIDKLKRVTRAVTRYAVVLESGHNEESHKQDYIKAVVKTFNRAQNDKPDSPEVPDTPFAEFVKHYSSNKNYLDNMEILARIVADQNVVDVMQLWFFKIMDNILRTHRYRIANGLEKAIPVSMRRRLKSGFNLVKLTLEDMVDELFENHPDEYESLKIALEHFVGKELPHPSGYQEIVKIHWDADNNSLFMPSWLYANLAKPDAPGNPAIKVDNQTFVQVDAHDLRGVYAALQDIEQIRRQRDREKQEAWLTGEMDPRTYEIQKNLLKQAADTITKFQKKYGFEYKPVENRLGTAQAGDYWEFPTGYTRFKEFNQRLKDRFNAQVEIKDTFDHDVSPVQDSINFDELPLAEQLAYVAQIDKEEIDLLHEASKNQHRIRFDEGAVPDNDKVRKLRQVMSMPLRGDDIRGQMEAYIAIPDPSMIRDFRAERAIVGNDGDLRNIVKAYIHRLHPSVQDELINESMTSAGSIAGAPAKMGQLMKRPSFPKANVGKKKKNKRLGLPESEDTIEQTHEGDVVGLPPHKQDVKHCTCPHDDDDPNKDMGTDPRCPFHGIKAKLDKKMSEKAPPGREDQVKALKKKFPKDPDAPYAISWAQHNKKKKK